MDIKIVILNDNLKEKIYNKQPEDFMIHRQENKFNSCQLNLGIHL